METKLCNVKVDHIRPGYQTLADWTADPVNVYIGRKGVVLLGPPGSKRRYPEVDSPWANPFKVSGEDGRLECIAKYKEYILKTLKENPHLWDELELLRGKTLGCWCHPLPCHGDVLIELLEVSGTRVPVARGGMLYLIIKLLCSDELLDILRYDGSPIVEELEYLELRCMSQTLDSVREISRDMHEYVMKLKSLLFRAG
jgi:hypothetical protein